MKNFKNTPTLSSSGPTGGTIPSLSYSGLTGVSIGQRNHYYGFSGRTPDGVCRRMTGESELSSLGPTGGTTKQQCRMDSRFCRNDRGKELSSSGPLSSLSPSGLTGGSIGQECRLAQSGRSMVEMLGTLAIIGVLSVGGITGYSYAMDKSKANRIMKDVELAYINSSSSNQKDGMLTEYTDALSSYPTFTELIMDEDFQTDIVLVKNVPESVCDKILEMTESSDWIVSAVEQDTNYLYPLSDCEDTNAMVFSTEDVRDFAYACEKECPANMMCGVNDNCICAYGFKADETGVCQEIQCDKTTEVMCTFDRGEKWCCPYNTFCSETEIGQCIPSDGSCIYYFYSMSENGFKYTTDCSYVISKNDNQMVVAPQKECSDPQQYCALNWTKEKWDGGETIPKAQHSFLGTIYGKCQKRSLFSSIPILYASTENPYYYIQKECPKKQYCHLQWSNDQCDSAYHSKRGLIYGACADMHSSNKICPLKIEEK